MFERHEVFVNTTYGSLYCVDVVPEINGNEKYQTLFSCSVCTCVDLEALVNFILPLCIPRPYNNYPEPFFPSLTPCGGAGETKESGRRAIQYRLSHTAGF